MQINNSNKTILNNGVRIVTENIPGVRSVSIGIWVGVGSRNETSSESGISHFIEHMLFKGTQKRSAAQIAESLEAVGGQLNAFTTREYTCYYARVLDDNLDLAIDVLTDIFFNSIFADEMIEKERGVVEEEIRMYDDTPDELIHDIAIQNIWPEDSLGRPILGNYKSLNEINTQKIMNYMNDNYLPSNCVVAVAGNVDHESILNKLGGIFECWNNKANMKEFNTPKKIFNVSNLYRKTEQVQICLSTDGLSYDDSRIYSLMILNNVLGGGLSSRLMQSIRENHGLAYSVYTYHSAFRDTGLFTIYVGTSPQKYEDVLKLLFEELLDVYLNGITQKELTNTKEQLKGNLYLGLESVNSRMIRLGRSELTLKRILTPEEIVEKLYAVKMEDICSLSEDLFAQNNFSLSTIGPLSKNTDLSIYKLTK